MTRLIVVLLVLAFTAGAVVAYKDQETGVRASDTVSDPVNERASARAVQISRGQGGEFALRAKINGVTAPMILARSANSPPWPREICSARAEARSRTGSETVSEARTPVPWSL